MKFSFLFFITLSSTLFAQIDFDNYTTIQASGEIPEDFTKRTYQKLEEDLSNSEDNGLSERDERIFYEGINYAVDDLMHSGYVVFGDSLSTYIQEVANKLLRKDKELRKELRFYVLKSNSTNAFSTAQGIVFVTTGLLSQITSEAQLAFILAHEISHYKEHHVLESFAYKANNKRESIENMSIYSKEKELEADKLGVKMYADAGYSKEEAFMVFGVLLYSYLPFDEIEITLDYFQPSDSLYFPGQLFPSEKFEIKAIEDDDDSRSSHPNIKKRKEAIEKEFATIRNWGSETNLFGEERFNKMRDIARFEVLRNDVLSAEYAKALYNIFLLEKKYPNSTYLKRMKAHTWLGILQYRADNSMRDITLSKKDWEGESASVHFFLKNMRKDELITVAVRQLYDIYQATPEDVEIKLIYDRMVKELVFSESFDIEDYATFSFNTAYEKFLANKEADSTSQTNETIEEKPVKKNKYDRIKNQKDPNIISAISFDSTEFFTYLIPDIITDANFLERLDSYQEEFDTLRAIEEKFSSLPYRERLKLMEQARENEMRLGLQEVISVEPFVLSYKSSGVDRVKSEKLKEIVTDKMDEASELSGIDVYMLKTPDESSNLNLFNERSVLFNFLEQMALNEEINAFPVDYSLLRNLERDYGTSKVMYSVVSHYYDVDITSINTAFWATIIYPIGLVYFPLKITSGHNMNIDVIIFDTKEGTVEGTRELYVKSGLNQHIIGAYFYDLFHLLKSVK